MGTRVRCPSSGMQSPASARTTRRVSPGPAGWKIPEYGWMPWVVLLRERKAASDNGPRPSGFGWVRLKGMSALLLLLGCTGLFCNNGTVIIA